MTAANNPSPAKVAAAILAAVNSGKRIYTAVVVTSSDPTLAGRRWWLCDGVVHGGLGHPWLDEQVATVAPELFSPSETHATASRNFRFPDGDSDFIATVYLELHAPPPLFVIVGAGHLAVPLCQLAAMLDLRVEVLDDRPEFASPERFPQAHSVRVIDFREPFRDTVLDPSAHVVLVTRGHRFDYECLIRLLRMPSPPAYIGMIGSRRRVRATHEQLARDGFSPEEMSLVRAPVGLDLGGQTPVEIAVSVIAEVIMFHCGGSGLPLLQKERVVERFFKRPKSTDAPQTKEG